MATKTFVLGAGFSVGAGFPLVRNLRAEVFRFMETTTDPLLRALIDPRLPEFPTGQVGGVIHAVDPEAQMGFEELLFALRATRSRERISATAFALRSACAKLLWQKQEALETLPVSYRNFASWLNESHFPGPRNAVISLNWDLLAERALDDNGVPWGYSRLQPVPVIKPHGSINWSQHRQPDCSWWQPISPGSPYCYIPTDPNDPDSIGPFSDPFRDGVNEDLRYMVFPGDPEDEDGVIQIWADTEQVIRARDVVVFIGYSLPPYDAAARECFRRTTSGKTVEVFNRSVEMLENYRNFLSLASVVTTEPISFENCPYAQNLCK